MSDAPDAELIVGTYEDYVVGYRIIRSKGPKNKRPKLGTNDCNREGSAKRPDCILEQSFAVRGHSGSVISVAASSAGTLAVSAGYDEMINIFGLKKRKLLQTFEGSVKCAAFVENSHLICGSEDSNIYIYEFSKNNFNIAKTLKGHKSAVTSLSVHPSGKVLLSISKDETMRTWNLIKGRCAFVTHIKPHSHLVSWSISGEEFIIAADKEIYLYNNSGNLEHSIKLEKRINSVEFITKNVFAVATDSGQLEFIDLKQGVSMMKFAAHYSRIKSVKRFSRVESSVVRFATASSDGTIKIWESTQLGLVEPLELANLDTGARLTCMAAARS